MSEYAHDHGATADAWAGLAEEPPKVYVEKGSGRLRITMYATANAQVTWAAVTVFLCSAVALCSAPSPEAYGYLLHWATIAMVVAAVVMTVCGLVWALGGQEVLTLDDQALHIQRGLGDFGRTATYRLADIQDLRLDHTTFGPWIGRAMAPPARAWRRLDVPRSLELVLPDRNVRFAMGLLPYKLEAIHQLLTSHPNWPQTRQPGTPARPAGIV